MDVEFLKDALQRLETDEGFHAGFAREIVRAFRKVMNAIRNALDERDLYQLRSLRFEKLKGDRAHQHSLRLNQQWRLIVQIKSGTPKNIIVIVAIEDYH